MKSIITKSIFCYLTLAFYQDPVDARARAKDRATARPRIRARDGSARNFFYFLREKRTYNKMTTIKHNQ